MGATTRLVRHLIYIFMCGFIGFSYILLLSLLNTYSQYKYDQIDIDDNTETILQVPAQLHDNDKVRPHPPTNKTVNSNLKYILVPADEYPFHFLKDGQDVLNNNRCKHRNCYFTHNFKYLKDPAEFDAILFNGCNLNLSVHRSPSYIKRSPKQKYIFASIEPSPKFPVTNTISENFFNWTWTYRLESDITWRYFTIYDLKGNEIGPATDIKWPMNLKPIDENLKNKLGLKTKAVAWFVSHCYTHNRRELFFEKFKREFIKFGFTVDVYGKCGQLQCETSMWCFQMLKKYYYFYLSFEHTSDEDYVTEKLLTALNNLVVPVVYGGANYSRFLHPDSYLNAKELGPIKLAAVMNEALRNSTLYYNYFRWRNHFKYESSETTSEICNICTALNDEEKMKTSMVTNFRSWWNTPTRQNIYEFVLRNILFNKNLQDAARGYNGTHESKLTMLEHLRNQTSVVPIKYKNGIDSLSITDASFLSSDSSI